MRRFLKAITIGAFLVLTLLGLFSTGPDRLSAEDTGFSPWLDNQLTHRIEAENAVLQPRSSLGAYCADYSFILKTNSPGQPVNYPVTDSSCAVYTSFGVADGSNLHEHGEKYAGRVLPRSGSVYHWLPNSDHLIEIRNGNPNKHFRIYPDFIEKNQPKNVNWTFNTYQLTADYLPAVNSANQPVNLDTNPLYVSTNNKWALAYSPNRGSVRISLESGQTLLFGLGQKPSAFAVSDDGRYTAVYYPQAEETIVYDLESCVPGANVNNPQDCQNRELTDYITENFGPVDKIERFRFLGSEHLELIIRQTGGSTVRYVEVQLTPTGRLLNPSNSYIAMGDSFASGEGDLNDSWYEVGTDEPENKCHLSRRSYPYLINQLLNLEEFHSVACSGAETIHILNKTQNDDKPLNSSIDEDWLPGSQLQIDFLSLLQEPQFISLSIGGNDVGFKSKLINCLLPATCNYADDSSWRSNVAKEIADTHKTLVNAYKEIVAETLGESKLFIIGYPQIASVEGSCGLNVHLDQAERKFVFEATKYMNQVIASAATEAGVYYLDTEQALDGHNLCSDIPDEDMAVNGISFSNSALLRLDLGWMGLGDTRFLVPGVSESFHPNHNGHRLLSSKILNLTGNNPLTYSICEDIALNVCPHDSPIPMPDPSYWGDEAVVYASSIGNPAQASASGPPEHRKLIAEDSQNEDFIKIFVTNLKPNSPVKLEVHSEPVALGEFVADNAGLLDIAVPVPKDVAPGFHTLRLYGVETTGDAFEYYEHILVPGPLGDTDNDGLLDADDPCGFIEASGTDLDQDGIDDACDGFIEASTVDNTVSGGNQVQGVASNGQANTAGEVASNNSEPLVYVSTGHNSDGRSVVVNVEGGGGYVKSLAKNAGNTTHNGNAGSFPGAWTWFVVTGLVLIGLSYLLRRYSTNS